MSIRRRKQSFLPELWTRALENYVKRLQGMLLLAIGVMLSCCLGTYSSYDPSFNVSSDLPAGNALGYVGACIADVSLQTLGIVAVLIPLSIITWGLRLYVRSVPENVTRRAVSLSSSLILLAFAAGLLPQYDGWPLMCSMGGILGSLGRHITEILVQKWGSIVNVITFLIMSIGGTLLAIYGFGSNIYSLLGSLKNMFSRSRKALNTEMTVRIPKFDLRRPNKQKEDPEEYQDDEEQDIDEDFIEADYDSANTHMQDDEETDDCDMEHASLAPAEQSVDNKFQPVKLQPRSRSQIIDDIEDFELPDYDLLDASKIQKTKQVSQKILDSSAQQLETVLEEFGVRGEIVNVRPGPVVTLYELKPAPGIKTSRVIGLADDIARSMSALSARIAVVPGQNVIGIELPNKGRETVFMRELLSAKNYEESTANLPLILGKDIGGQPIVTDLSKMPHLLVAGTTGSGKSVAINTMILSLLFQLRPDQCKFIMVDPKMLELSVYDDIPHLLTPVVTDPKQAVVALKWVVKEMENRYRSMAKVGVRNIMGYNARVKQVQESGEVLMRRIQTGFDPETGKPVFENQPINMEELPYIVVVVDEMADLMLVAGKEIEAAVQRLAQMARAAGIHLIMATQRPSVDVITGTIKANFPTRISFQVSSKIDSRTILGEQGAEQLLGQGDMLYMAGGGRILRVHGPFVSDSEVEKVVSYLKTQGEPSYIGSVTEESEESGSGQDEASEGDQMYNDALNLILAEGKASTSFIQRHLQIGYNRAARIMDQLEKNGVVSPANHVGKREILREA